MTILCAALAASVLFAACGSGDDPPTSEACAELESELCRLDEACHSPDPCSFACEKVPPANDEQTLRACVEQIKAIVVPDELQEPMQHAMSCSSIALKKISCLSCFAGRSTD